MNRTSIIICLALAALVGAYAWFQKSAMHDSSPPRMEQGFVSHATPSSPPSPHPVTLAELITSGQETEQAVAKGEAHLGWTTRLLIPGGVLVVNNTVEGNRADHVVWEVNGTGQRREIFSVLEREGVWFAQEDGRRLGKYRPWEAPFVYPNAYSWLQMATLRVLPRDTTGTVVSEEGRTATVQVELSPWKKNMAQAVLMASQEVVDNSHDPQLVEDGKARIAQFQQFMAQGEMLQVDVPTGIILASIGPSGVRITTSLAAVDIKIRDFNAKAQDWQDVTNDPTLTGNRNDLITLVYSFETAVVAPNRPVDLRLVDLSSGQMRRIPFRGTECVLGCFSPDRQCVYVYGGALDSGLGVYEINLSTGKNRRLGEGTLPAGAPMNPALSKDGGTLALLAVPSVTKAQICLLDLSSGKVRRLGPPMDASFLSWLEDGTGLVLESRKSVGWDKPSQEFISRIDLEGKMTVLCPGRSPVLLPGRNKILFSQDDLWKTCNLHGGGVELYTGGMKGFAGPSCSPDGKQIAWMDLRNKQKPHLVFQNFGSEDVHPLSFDLDPGLWGGPAWQ